MEAETPRSRPGLSLTRGLLLHVSISLSPLFPAIPLRFTIYMETKSFLKKLEKKKKLDHLMFSLWTIGAFHLAEAN